MPLSGAERSRLWRQRKKENEEEHRRYLEKERLRYHKRREKGEVKLVSEMTDREKRTARKTWRVRKQRQRSKQNPNFDLTPPPTPTPGPFPIRLNNNSSNPSKQRMRKDRAKAYREIEKLRKQVSLQKTVIERYKKRLYRQSKKNVDPNSPRTKTRNLLKGQRVDGSVRKTILFHHVFLKGLREKYKQTKSEIVKQVLAKALRSKILKKYRMQNIAKYQLNLTQRRINVSDCNNTLYTRKTRGGDLLQKMRFDVETFLCRDDNSRLTTDKQATLTQNKVKMQKRLMNQDLKTLHAKYESEGNKILYSMFCRLRPFWIVKPTERDRSTCLCKLHENLEFKTTVCYKENMIKSKDATDLIDDIVCSQSSKDCMYRECSGCQDKELPCTNGDGKQVEWQMWKNQRMEKNNDGETKIINKTVKENIQGTRQTLAGETNKELIRACRHFFNIRHQYKTLRYLHKEMSHEELMIHMDFSENYNAKYASEIQSVHFGASRRQISLHTGVAYLGNETVSFCTVSDCLKHGPAAIWAHLHPVIERLRERTNINAIHFVSDGPTTQYRNKQNFYLWSTRIFDYGCQYSTWNFLEASHGKGAADGVGAAIKRGADSQVNVNGKDITDGKMLVAALQDCTKVRLFYVEESSIDEIEKGLPSIKPLAQTMKIHQLYTNKRGEVSHRHLSCFCQNPEMCSCFSPVKVQLSTDHDVNSQSGRSATDDPRKQTSSSSNEPVNSPSGRSATDDHRNQMSHSSNEPAETKIKHIEEFNETLIGQHCVIEYDGLPYPGVILDIDEDTAEVRAMCRIGANRFFWPMVEDRVWYEKDKIITLLSKEPELVTARHRKLDDQLWKDICNALQLDDRGKK